MPEKRRVIVGMRSWQEDGRVEHARLQGELHTLVTGWALTYKEPEDEAGSITTMTLIIHDKELRLRRRGTVSLEQIYQAGMTLPGKMITPYSTEYVEALTTQLDIDLSEHGGVIEWKYDLLMQEQAVGSFHIRLDIRGEEAG